MLLLWRFKSNMADDESRIRLSRSFYISMLSRIRRRRHLLQTTVMNLVSRRRHILSICILLLVALIKRNDVVEPIRSCRRLLRNSGWWDTVWKYSEARFKKTFRVTRGTFLYILSRIRQQLERQTVTEDPIFPELRLAICLYRLGRGWLLLHHCRNDRTRGFNRMHYCTRGFTSYYRLYVGREYFKAHAKIWGRI